jgi:phosphoenolpyruvate carboxylase
MATQHPDNALPPYWDKSGKAFISVYQEIEEAVNCFKDLGVSEYMWDWEGKHADAAVIDRLFSEYYDYFAKNQLGRDKFLTFRIPNIWEEKGYNLLQAMTVILSSEDFARDLKLQNRPLFEIILPMTERADQLIHMQRLFEKLAKFKSNEFSTDHTTNTSYLEIIPLVESVESQLAVGDLLNEYVKFHKQHFGDNPEYIRPFLAFSDSALSSGLLAGLLGNKIALSRLYEFSATSGIPVYPIVGPGSPLFRGGLSPEPKEIDRFISEFPGARTVTVQSSFRYDHPQKLVKSAVARLEKELPQVKPQIIPADQQSKLIGIIGRSTELYKASLNVVITDMKDIFDAVPKRRDRRQHIGLLAYSRSMGELTLPRAITFTSGFYSIGVPPELIGFGRTLAALSPAELKLLKAIYPNMSEDFRAAGGYYNSDNLAKLVAGNSAWKAIQDDVIATERVLGIRLGSQTRDQAKHKTLSSKLLQAKDKQSRSQLITEMGILRGSLG